MTFQWLYEDKFSAVIVKSYFKKFTTTLFKGFEQDFSKLITFFYRVLLVVMIASQACLPLSSLLQKIHSHSLRNI